ncbi:MAG: RNA polymerase sigma-70 factor [Terrimonas sp.]|nr:RNA polymerase sigma-70 factor [Terrimonas sp.]OJY93880.1 MAG: hypothetical protein BGP13_01140 [Sphingobacteriales bacterium 40-81]
MKQAQTGSKDTKSAVTASSFETIFKTLYKELFGYACTLIKHEPAAEGIVQQVFLNLWSNRDTLVIDISIKAYLYKSVYNYCLNYLKHQQVRSAHEKYIAKQLPVHAVNTEGKVLGEELRSHILEALNALPEQCGIVFRMSRFEGLKYQEIADKLGLSVKTIEVQMGKALRLMRARLAEYLSITIGIVMLTG